MHRHSASEESEKVDRVLIIPEITYHGKDEHFLLCARELYGIVSDKMVWPGCTLEKTISVTM